VTTSTAQRPVGELLRGWREHRRLSQLELSIQAEISTRHLSFLETGRSAPSRDMVLRLAEQLELPLRERNQLLLAAGFAPVYPQSALDAPPMAAIRSAVRQVLTGHEPYPALAVDRAWNLVDGNASLSLLTAGAAEHLLVPPANVLRLALHPEGLAPRIVNFGEWRAHLLGRLHHQVKLTGAAELAELHQELLTYPGGLAPEHELPGPGEVVVPLRIRHGDAVLSFLSTVTVFGSPVDITVSELAIESFFPADPATAETLRSTTPVRR
jgi:transcriptional regulator with XRE-family HTH domain